MRETLRYAADFWMVDSAAEKEDRIDRLLKELGLESALRKKREDRSALISELRLAVQAVRIP